MHFAEIETARLRLRPIAASDWPAILAYMSDPQVTAYLPPGVFDEQAARAFTLKQSGADRTAVAAIEKASAQLIGHMPYHAWFEPQTYEIGWAFHPAHQGRGYATEAARAIIAHAFDTLKAHRVIATCQPENPASWRVAEKLGLRREAHFRSALHRGPGIWWDEYVYALLADEWAAR
ncbi:MAG: GNAT family N-acetyltransferase [Alphaproteobacteria bacterium]|nr:GNAT family N-acetyltransferase [Alphaproteobacteria bacterium]